MGSSIEARQKRDELLDIVQHHNGVYLGKKAKKKLKISGREKEGAAPSTGL
jgi:hypothetical protein